MFNKVVEKVVQQVLKDIEFLQFLMKKVSSFSYRLHDINSS